MRGKLYLNFSLFRLVSSPEKSEREGGSSLGEGRKGGSCLGDEREGGSCMGEEREEEES